MEILKNIQKGKGGKRMGDDHMEGGALEGLFGNEKKSGPQMGSANIQNIEAKIEAGEPITTAERKAYEEYKKQQRQQQADEEAAREQS